VQIHGFGVKAFEVIYGPTLHDAVLQTDKFAGQYELGLRG